MKKSSTGLFCVCLLASWGAMPSRAQDPQTPPATPAQDTPAPPQTGQPNIQAPPDLPKYPDVRMPGESGFWIGLTGYVPTGHPFFDKGSNAGYLTSSRIEFQGKPKVGAGGEIGIALGLHNALKISYFQTSASGNLTAPNDLVLWSQTYTKGMYLSTNYKVRDVKISFDYLTWPYPVESRRFRLKTLWQLQYISVRSGFDAPKESTTDSSGNQLIDSNGNPLSYAVQGTRWFLTPTLGLGITEYASRHVRFEANASGFGIPHHWTVWDVDASVNLRFGHFELGAGARAFHVKTSTSGPYYTRGTLTSPMVSLRWYSQ